MEQNSEPSELVITVQARTPESRGVTDISVIELAVLLTGIHRSLNRAVSGKEKALPYRESMTVDLAIKRIETGSVILNTWIAANAWAAAHPLELLAGNLLLSSPGMNLSDSLVRAVRRVPGGADKVFTVSLRMAQQFIEIVLERVGGRARVIAVRKEPYLTDESETR